MDNDNGFTWEDFQRQVGPGPLVGLPGLTAPPKRNSAFSETAGYQWQQYRSDELPGVFFGGQKASASDAPIEVTDETGIYQGLSIKAGGYYRNDIYQFKIKLFISYDGAKLLRAHHSTTPADDELLIFLENNTDDRFSEAQLLIHAGKNVVSQMERFAQTDVVHKWVNSKYTISREDLTRLISSAGDKHTFVNIFKAITNFLSPLVSWVPAKIADAFDWIGEKIESLKIADETWDKKSTIDFKKWFGELRQGTDNFFGNFFSGAPYLLPKGVRTFIPEAQNRIKQVLAVVEKFMVDYGNEIIELVFAAVCGIINGIIDLVAGIFRFVALIIRLMLAERKMATNAVTDISYYIDLILEYADNLFQAIKKVDWGKVLADAVNAHFKFFFVTIPQLIANSTTNARQVAYYFGYIGINILDFFVPVLNLLQLGRITKVGKLLEPLYDIILKALGKVKVAAIKSIEEFFILLDGFIEIMKKGTDEVVGIVKRIFDRIKQWVEEVLGVKKIRWNLLEDVPEIKSFIKWFDDLTLEEFEIIWNNPVLQNKVKCRLRHPGGLHEWLMVSRANTFKRWNVSVKEMKLLRTKIEDVVFVNPPGIHGGPGSTKAHNEILQIIDSSLDYKDFKKNLIIWAEKRLKGGAKNLPSGFLK